MLSLGYCLCGIVHNPPGSFLPEIPACSGIGYTKLPVRVGVCFCGVPFKVYSSLMHSVARMKWLVKMNE